MLCISPCLQGKAEYVCIIDFLVASILKRTRRCVTPVAHYAYSRRIPVPDPLKSAIVITGCSSGIGKHAALELAAAGYLVFAGVRNAKDNAALKSEAASRGVGDRIAPILLDVTDSNSLAQAVADVHAALSGGQYAGRALVGLINNAGVAHVGAIETIAMKDVRLVFVHACGYFLL